MSHRPLVKPPEPVRSEYDIAPGTHADLRRTVLSWAVSTAKNGEPSASVMERAETYLAFVLDPLRADQVQAAAERSAAPLH